MTAEKAIRALLAHLPELWGDHIVGGQMTIKVDEDAIHDALRAMDPGSRAEVLTDAERDERFEVANAMIQYGGSFVSALGAALHKADGENTKRIKAAFPHYWQSYQELARADKAQKGRS